MAANSSVNALLFHKRAGHPSQEALKKMFGANNSTLDCRACCLSKSTLLPFSRTLSNTILDSGICIYGSKWKNHATYVRRGAFTTLKSLMPSLRRVYFYNEFEEFYKQKRITHQGTAPYTPQQKSVAERGNQTTSEKARALLKEANLP